VSDFLFVGFRFLCAAFHLTVCICDGIRSGEAGLARQLPFRSFYIQPQLP
jgi:hypothetical protein